MRTIKIGCPSFILRDLLYVDFTGTMEKVGKIGYDGIELIGFFGHSADMIRKTCLSNGLEPFGCFAMLPDLLCLDEPEGFGAADDPRSLMTAMRAMGNTPDEKFGYIREIGCSYISLGISAGQTPEDFAALVMRALPVAEKFGLKLQYHNHSQEYEKTGDGMLIMDRLMELCPAEMLFEPDLGWMGIAGCGYEDGVSAYRDRIKAVHMKDYYREGADKLDKAKPFFFRPTGYGVMDWASVLEYCEDNIRPDWYVCDHDSAYSRDIIRELQLSCEYLRKQLEYYGVSE